MKGKGLVVATLTTLLTFAPMSNVYAGKFSNVQTKKAGATCQNWDTHPNADKEFPQMGKLDESDLWMIRQGFSKLIVYPKEVSTLTCSSSPESSGCNLSAILNVGDITIYGFTDFLFNKPNVEDWKYKGKEIPREEMKQGIFKLHTRMQKMAELEVVLKKGIRENKPVELYGVLYGCEKNSGLGPYADFLITGYKGFHEGPGKIKILQDASYGNMKIPKCMDLFKEWMYKDPRKVSRHPVPEEGEF